MLSRDQIIASQLSQEGIELVRNIRENNVAAGENWNESLSGSSNICVSYDMNTKNPDLSCVTNNLYYNLSNYTYSHNSANSNSTRFYRQISISPRDVTSPPDGNIDEIEIISYVWWGGSTKPASCTNANKCVLVKNTLMPYE